MKSPLRDLMQFCDGNVFDDDLSLFELKNIPSNIEPFEHQRR
jgi:hypothetical protein